MKKLGCKCEGLDCLSFSRGIQVSKKSCLLQSHSFSIFPASQLILQLHRSAMHINFFSWHWKNSSDAHLKIKMWCCWLNDKWHMTSILIRDSQASSSFGRFAWPLWNIHPAHISKWYSNCKSRFQTKLSWAVHLACQSRRIFLDNVCDS